MPASFSPAPNSMANLSLEAESQLGYPGPSSGACSLDTGTPTVPCIPPTTEPEPEAGGSSEDKEGGGQDGRKK